MCVGGGGGGGGGGATFSEPELLAADLDTTALLGLLLELLYHINTITV